MNIPLILLCFTTVDSNDVKATNLELNNLNFALRTYHALHDVGNIRSLFGD